jgi:hypothetical protein
MPDKEATAPAAARTANLGQLAIQETMNDFALDQPRQTSVFLFEDHKMARASFLLPDNCRKISTRACLLFLEQQGWLASAADIERRAIQAGRSLARHRHRTPHRHRPRHPRRQGARPQIPGRADHHCADLLVDGRHGRRERGTRRQAQVLHRRLRPRRMGHHRHGKYISHHTAGPL